MTADRESRNVKDSSEWKLNTNIFHRLVLRWGNPEIHLFASRTSHQLPQYVSLKADPQCTQVDAFERNWGKLIPYVFPPILPYTENFKESMQRTSQGNDLDHTTVVNPTMVPLSPDHVNKKILS